MNKQTQHHALQLRLHRHRLHGLRRVPHVPHLRGEGPGAAAAFHPAPARGMETWRLALGHGEKKDGNGGGNEVTNKNG